MPCLRKPILALNRKRGDLVVHIGEVGNDGLPLYEKWEAVKRFTRLMNGHSKKVDDHAHAFSLYAMVYNFCRSYGVLSSKRGIKTTPAMAAELEPFPSTTPDVVERMDADRKLMAAGS